MAQTIEELQADRDALAVARLSRLTTGVVKEVSRAGRKLVKENATLEDLNFAIAELDASIANAGGTRRRRALTLGYR